MKTSNHWVPYYLKQKSRSRLYKSTSSFAQFFKMAVLWSDEKNAIEPLRLFQNREENCFEQMAPTIMLLHVQASAWKGASSYTNIKALSTCSAPAEGAPCRVVSVPWRCAKDALADLQLTPSHLRRLPDSFCPGPVPSQESEAGEWLKSSRDIRQLDRKMMTLDFNTEKGPWASKIMKLLMKWNIMLRQKPICGYDSYIWKV